MPDDVLSIILRGRDEGAASTIARVETSIKSISREIEQLRTQSATSAAEFERNLTSIAAKRGEYERRYGEYAGGIAIKKESEAAVAASEEESRAIADSIAERERRIQTLRGEAVGLYPQKVELGPDVGALALQDREIKSASASASVLSRSLLSSAEADDRLRQEAAAAALALSQQAEAQHQFNAATARGAELARTNAVAVKEMTARLREHDVAQKEAFAFQEQMAAKGPVRYEYAEGGGYRTVDVEEEGRRAAHLAAMRAGAAEEAALRAQGDQILAESNQKQIDAIAQQEAARQRQLQIEREINENRRAEAQRQFDAETAAMERMAQQQAVILREMQSRLRAYYSEQAAAQQEAFRYQEQMATRAPVRYELTEEGRYRTIDVEEESRARAVSEAKKAGEREVMELGAQADALKEEWHRKELNRQAEETAAAKRHYELNKTAIEGQIAQEESLASIRRAAEGEEARRRYQAQAQAARAAAPYSPAEMESINAWAQAMSDHANRTQQATSNINAAGHAARNFARDAHGAAGATQSWGFIFRELVVEMGEFARGQRGQEISTFLAAMRRLGGMGSLALFAPLVAAIGALRVGGLAREYGELAEKTDLAARAAGMSIEQYSKLQVMLELVGANGKEASRSLESLGEALKTASTEPLGEKGTAFAEILGKDFWTDLPRLIADPSARMDELNRKFNELAASVGRAAAEGVFRRALGTEAWNNLVAVITLTRDKYLELSQVPPFFTEADTEKLKAYAEALHKLSVDWARLGEAMAVLTASTGLLDFLDSVINRVTELTRHLERLIPMLAGAVAGAMAGAPLGPLGMAAGAIAGAAGAEEITRRVQAESAQAEIERKYGPGAAYAPLPAAPPEAPAVPPPRVKAPSPEEAARYPVLYGAGTIVDAEKIASEAAKQRAEIEQSNRLTFARIEAEKAEAMNRARGAAEINQIEAEYAQKEIEAREKAVALEKEMVEKYKERLKDVPEAVRPFAARELERRVGIAIDVEELNTKRKISEEEKRLRLETFRVFEETKRNELELARDNFTQQEAIYQQLLAAAKEAFGQESVEYQKIKAEEVRAAQAAHDRIFQAQMQAADRETSILVTQARMRATAREAEALTTTVGRPSRAAAIREEITELQSLAQAQEAVYAALAADQSNTTKERMEALEKEASIATETYSREIQLAKQLAEEQKRAAEEATKAFTQLFDKIGGAMETFLDDAIFRTKTFRQAIGDLLRSIDKDIIRSVEQIGSQLAAQALSKAFGVELQPGKGLGDLFGALVGRFLGLGQRPDAQAALQQAILAGNRQRDIANNILKEIQQLNQQLLQQAKAASAVAPGAAGAGVAGPSETAAEYAAGRGPLPGDPRMASQMFQWLREHGYTVQAASAVIGNAIQESGLRPGITGKAGELGMFQELGARRRGLEEYAASTGRAATDWRVQMEYMDRELQGINPNFKTLTDSSGKLAVQFSKEFERPSPQYAADPRRAGYAEQIEAKYGKGEPVPVIIVGGVAGTTARGPAGTAGDPTSVNITSVGGQTVRTTIPIDTSGVVGAPGTQSGYAAIAPSEGAYAPLPPAMQLGGLTPPNSSDTLLSWLTPGEFVVKKGAVDHYGPGFLHSLNSMTLPRAQFGGLASFFGIGTAQAGAPGALDVGTSRYDPIASVIAGLFGQPLGSLRSQYQGLFGPPDPLDPDDPRRARRYWMGGLTPGGLASYQGGGEVTAEQARSDVITSLFGPRSYQHPEAYQMGGWAFYQMGGLASGSRPGLTTLTVESRGMIRPHLVQAYPPAKLGPLLAILGVSGALLGGIGLYEWLTKEDEQKRLAEKLLAAPPSGPEVIRTGTTALTQEQLDKFKSLNIAPQFHSGGLASDETLAKLQVGERVLSREQNKIYESTPQFHYGGLVSGGHVWPSFQEGGPVSPTYSPPVGGGGVGTESKALIGSISSLTSGMSALSQDVQRIAGGFTALERGTTQQVSATQRFTSGLSSASGALQGLQGVVGSMGGLFGGGGGGGGGGGIFGMAGGILGGIAKIGGLFALEHGGIIPSAQGGMIAGGIPGGMLSLLHEQEMVLPAHISNFVQQAAASYTGTRGGVQDFTGGDVHNTFNISGVVNSHDVGRLFMQHFGTIMRAVQRGARNNFEFPR